MTDLQWNAFIKFKSEFYKKVEEWREQTPELTALQKQAALEAETPEYPFETPVVYNRDLDKITKDDEIKLFVIGDNPGKDEQLLKNNRYLVGQAGKIADGFFKRNAELGVDFRKNVIILNKTPVHSAKTIQLKKMMQLGGAKIENLIQESQIWMAKKTAEFFAEFYEGADGAVGTKTSGGELSSGGEASFCANASFITKPELWLVGYSELKDKHFFVSYRDKLKSTICSSGGNALPCGGSPSAWEQVYVFQHFSMNRFTIDLKEMCENFDNTASLLQKIHFVGTKHREEIFGC